jgi:hypothetical protein
VLALLLTVAPAARAADPHYLVVRGRGPAVADVTFAHPFQLLLDPGRPAPYVTTRGTYAGIWVEDVRARKNLGVGVAVVPAMRGLGGDVPLAWGYTQSELPAGRYRVHLLADGAAEIRVPVTGLSHDVVVKPTGRDQVRATLRDITLAPNVGSTDIGVAVYKTTMTILAASTDEDSSFAASSVCLTKQPDLPCGTTEGQGGSMTGGGVGTRSSTAFEVCVYPGDLKAGEYQAAYTAGTPRARKLYAFALSVTA